MRKSFIPLTVAIGVAVAACGGGDDPASPEADAASGSESSASATGGGSSSGGGTFSFTLNADPQNFDPHGPTSSNRSSLQVKRFMYDPLVNLSTEDADPRPGLAESWEETDEGLLFTLRDGITCADGEPLTATTVADNINWVADPANASAMLGVVIPPGTSATGDDAGNTVVLDSSIPAQFMLRQLSEFSIVCAAGLADHSTLEAASNGTGPYVLEEIVPGSELRLTRREGYAWGPIDVAWQMLPEQVVIRIVQNETTAANMLLAGEVNAAAIRGGDQDRLMAEDLPYEEFAVPVGQVSFNKRDGRPMADDAVRVALVQAMDREQASSIATSGKGQPTVGNAVAPYLCGGVDPESVMPAHDPAAAEATLTEAGWTRGDGGWTKDGETLGNLIFTYPAEAGPAVASAVEFLAEGLDAIGISSELQAVTPAQWVDQRARGDFDIAWAIFEADTPTHMVGLYAGSVPPEGRDWAGIANPLMVEIEENLEESTCDLWNEAEMWNYESASQIALDGIVVPYFSSGAEIGVGGIGGQIHPTTIRVLGD